VANKGDGIADGSRGLGLEQIFLDNRTIQQHLSFSVRGTRLPREV
jgi:hypothetical protein